jgi:hypothetical protein
MPGSVRSFSLSLSRLVLILALCTQLHAIGQPRYVEEKCVAGCFTLANETTLATIIVDPKDYPGVVRAANDLQADVARVTGRTPALVKSTSASGPTAIIVGTLDRSEIIKRLVEAKKIDISNIHGKWESFFIQVVDRPMKGVSRALVIAGSDKRGAIYGVYDLSEQIGVSPWYWWADVPVKHRDNIFIRSGKFTQGEPAVKYRGIFLNDEAPSLTGWVNEKFGGYNHEFYVKVFELILRMKGNYLWPAMWNSAFNEDDPLNPELADEYGIVMGTSHHEPMLRAQQEWKRHGTGAWDYTKNAEVLKKFWAEGTERNKNYESITTVGMRGDGDMPMSLDANVELLERIVAEQRKIIAQHVNSDVTAVPQDWALYKEVQEYYEKGMRVPDDVTLLWSDDNWGNIRRLPTPEERKRKGGAGVYYHFDYVGGPRNYKWLNTVPIAKVWEQMNLAYQYGADRIWIVNVGDLKPMEFPIEFFLSLAWNPQRWPKESIAEYTRLWAEREFGPQFAPQIADIVSKYTKYNGRRKPELLEPGTFSLANYDEAERVIAEFQTITKQAEEIYRQLPEDQRDAFFELVLYPTKASAQVVELYVAAGKNQLYATQGRVSANEWAERTRTLFKEHAELSRYYNRTLAGGKWSHMMDQTHIGYTYWQQPPVDKMPSVTEVLPLDRPSMGVAVDGISVTDDFRPPATLQFSVFQQQRRHVDIFNCGHGTFEFTATASDPWIALSTTHGSVDKDEQLGVSVDWTRVPKGNTKGTLSIVGPDNQNVTIMIAATNPAEPARDSLEGFVEADGYVSIEAVHYANKLDSTKARWESIDDLGRTLSSMSIFPVTAASANPPQDSPLLEYKMYLFNPGDLEVEAILAPTQNFVPGRGLRYAISWDDQSPVVIDALEHNSLRDWEETVKDGVRKVKTKCSVAGVGYHTLKFWMVDPGIVLQKLMVNTGGLKPSYLGPPESYHNGTVGNAN